MPVASLISICSAFVIENISVLESLVGFPESLGEKLFTEFRTRWSSTSVDDPDSRRARLVHGLSVFGQAYGRLLLDAVSLRNQLIVINEFTECLLPLLTTVTALDLTHCQLGWRHELWAHFSTMHGLTDLRVSDCCLTDDIVRALTIPCRINAAGVIKLEILDVSCNPKLTKTCLRHLRCLTRLKVLHLSGTDITSVEASQFGLQLGMKLATGAEAGLLSIATSGWAQPLVQRWVESGRPLDSPRKEQHAHNGYCKFYASRRPAERLKMAEELKMSPPPKKHPELRLVRHRPCPVHAPGQRQAQPCQQSSAHPVSSSIASVEIDQDLANGYLTSLPAMPPASRHKRNLFDMLND